MTTNQEWLEQLDNNAPDELAAWFDAEHVEHQERALDGDTEALERKSADLIYEYYKPMVAELQAQVDELTAERDNLKDDLIDERGKLNRKMNALRDITRDYRNERDHYRSKFGKCLDYADAIHALMDDEGMA